MPLLVVWHISEHINVTFQLVYCNCKCKLLFFSRASDKEHVLDLPVSENNISSFCQHFYDTVCLIAFLRLVKL